MSQEIQQLTEHMETQEKLLAWYGMEKDQNLTTVWEELKALIKPKLESYIKKKECHLEEIEQSISIQISRQLQKSILGLQETIGNKKTEFEANLYAKLKIMTPRPSRMNAMV